MPAAAATGGKARILLIDDSKDVRDLLVTYFVREGYDVTEARDGEEGLSAAIREDFDLIVLDVMLPGLSGFEICRRLRKKKRTPVLMLSARDEDVDKILGLGLGADDYVTKPFNPREVVARVSAQLRRSRYARAAVADEGSGRLAAGPIALDPEAFTLTKHGREIDIPTKEFFLLKVLMENSDRVLTRDELLDRVWGPEYFGDPNTLTVHIRHLRKRLEDNPSAPRWIQTIRGVGYRFRPDGGEGRA